MSVGNNGSLLSYFDLRYSTLLCWGYLKSIASIICLRPSSFSYNGLATGISDLYLVGIFFIIDSNAASLPGAISSISEALLQTLQLLFAEASALLVLLVQTDDE